MDGDVEVESGAGGEPTVSAHRTSPERTVFTEKGNCDGWIASDLVVDLDR